MPTPAERSAWQTREFNLVNPRKLSIPKVQTLPMRARYNTANALRDLTRLLDEDSIACAVFERLTA